MSLACAEMVLSEVLLGAEFMAMCDLSGVAAAAAAESAYQRVALPEYPLWYDTAVTSRWFAAPGKLLRMDGRGLLAGWSPPGRLRTTSSRSARQSPASGKGLSNPPGAAPGFRAAVHATPEWLI
jgi:hypothetical protein